MRNFPQRMERLRIRLAEQRLARRLNHEGRTPAEVIRERRRRRLAAEGRACNRSLCSKILNGRRHEHWLKSYAGRDLRIVSLAHLEQHDQHSTPPEEA